MHCKEIGPYYLLHVVVQGPRSFRGPVNVSVPRTIAELRGVKIAQFSDFGLFSPIQKPVTSLQPRGYIAEWLRFFHVVVEGPKGCFRPRCFPATSGRGDGDPQTFTNFRLWQIPVQNDTTRRVRSGPKMSENAQFWGRMYFSTKYLRPYPQNHPKTPFWGTFQCKAYYTRSSP